MIDVNRQIKVAIKTGKVIFGCKKALEASKTGKAKLIILASNCPEDHKNDILYNAKISGIPVYIHPSNSLALASICEKPFVVAAMTIKDVGDSDIMKLVEK
ncbi:MAG: 50S ribosomal protein L30e [Candidatus Bathyarchaeia archaeon]